MPDNLLDVLSKKLGHGLEEVRVRTLETISSKLDRGFLKIADLLSTKEFLVKLLEWFGLDPCPRQDQVLALILRMLKDEGSSPIVIRIGASRVLLALSTIREGLPTELCPTLDEIANLVRRIQIVQAQDDDRLEPEVKKADEDESQSNMTTSLNLNNLDASLEEALQCQSNSESQRDRSDPRSTARNDIEVDVAVFSDVLKHVLLPWQPLVSTDRHVLMAVQESLANVTDRPQLLHTCSFVTDVMMRDFPAEVFLQRPAIVMTFFKLLSSSLLSDDEELAKMVISCLATLSVALRSRLRFYQDPNMANLKQESYLVNAEETSSQMSGAHSLQSTLNQEDQAELEQRKPRTSDWSRASSQHTISPVPSQAQSYQNSLPQTDDDDEKILYNTTQVPSESFDSDDSNSLQLRQCGIPQFCVLAMRYTLPYADTQPGVNTLMNHLIHLLTDCITPQLWLAPASNTVATVVATHLFEVLSMLGELLQQERFQCDSRLRHLQLLGITRHLLLQLVPLELADRCLPRQLKTALCGIVLDGPLHAFFPVLHSDLLQYTKVLRNIRDVESVKLYENTLSVAESLSSSAKLIHGTPTDVTNGSKFVQDIDCALPALTFHQDLQFVSLVLDSCSNNLESWQLTQGEYHTLSTVILKLLAHADIEIRRKTYSHLRSLVLNGLGVNHSYRFPDKTLGFLIFDTAVLLEITTHGISSTDSMVQKCAEDIILHALKGRAMLGASSWKRFVTNLAPVLPLLHCWAAKDSALGRAVVTMLNPDVGSQMDLDTAELLKGNMRLLFAQDEYIRGEALSRLIWLLTREENAFEKLPRIAGIHKCVTSNVCLVERPSDILQSVPEQQFYQESSLLQVLEITKADGVEPKVYTSALTQLAAMLEDPRLHELFLSRGGLQTVVDALHASVWDKKLNIHLEAAVPTVNILRCLCVHHTYTRHHVAQDIAVLFSIMRGLMMFATDSRLRTNASQLLALLLYSDVTLSASPRPLSDGTVVHAISLPHLIVQQMKLPFICGTHWRSSHFTEPVVKDILLRHDVCRMFLATAWNLSYFKGCQSPLLWTQSKPLPAAVLTALGTFSQSLQLKERDLMCLQASAMLHQCQKQLNDIQTASSHNGVIKAIHILESVLTLYEILKSSHKIMTDSLSDTAHFQDQYQTLPWRRSLQRFLVAAPASLDDQQLLVCLLRFLQIHVRTLRSVSNLLSSQSQSWLYSLLRQPSKPLPNLLSTVAHSGGAGDVEIPQALTHLPKWKELCKELLRTITECARLECTTRHFGENGKDAQRLHSEENKENKVSRKDRKERKSKEKVQVDSRPSSRSELERADRLVGEVIANVSGATKNEPKFGWTHIIQNIVSCLKSSDTQHFYNLAYLDWLLWALVHLTSETGWSASLDEADVKSLFSDLLKALLELVHAFHSECGKGGTSCMGLSITRGAILCLNHLLNEIKLCQNIKEWESFWEVAVNRGARVGSVSWLSSLCQSREPVVRASALQLAAGIAASPKGCLYVLKILATEPDFVWMPPLCILLDHDEACLVREQAVKFLTNLVRHCAPDVSGVRKGCFENEKSQPHLNLDVLRQHLIDCNFTSELWVLLEYLSVATCCDPRHCITGNAGVALKHISFGDSVALSSEENLQSNPCVLIHSQSESFIGCGEDRVGKLKHVASTPAFLQSVCNFLDVLLSLNEETLSSMAQQGLGTQLFRCLNTLPSYSSKTLRESLLYKDTVGMYASVCRIVTRCLSSCPKSCLTLLQQPETAHKLLLSLDPTACPETADMQGLCHELWSEVLWLIAVLLSLSLKDESHSGKEEYSAFHAVLIRSRGEPLMSVLTLALSGSVLTEFQRAALACMQSLFDHPASALGQPLSTLLDNGNADFNSSIPTEKEVDLSSSAGAELCHLLLRLYDVHGLQVGSCAGLPNSSSEWRTQRSIVMCALASLLQVSAAAREVALNLGFVELLCAQMGALQTHLMLDPLKTMKQLASRRKICPILQDVELLFHLLTSMAGSDLAVKQLAADVGVADIIHKLWTWCLHQPTLLLAALHLLLTLTSCCLPASHSLVLTTTVPGLGLRRAPSSHNLLHAIVALCLAETEKATSPHDLTVLRISFQVLSNSCHVPECRAALSKSNLLQGANYLHSCLTKRTKQWQEVETLWLTMFVQFTAFQEGQVVLPKVPDLLDYILSLAGSKKRNSVLALHVLRNISFHQINRPRLLGSVEFLQLMNKKISSGETADEVAAAATIWALTANNQKGKLIVKCAGTDAHILDALRQLAACHRPGGDFVAQLLNCVLRIVKSDASNV